MPAKTVDSLQIILCFFLGGEGGEGKSPYSVINCITNSTNSWQTYQLHAIKSMIANIIFLIIFFSVDTAFRITVWGKRRERRHRLQNEFPDTSHAMWRAWPLTIRSIMWRHHLFLIWRASFHCLERGRSVLENLRHIFILHYITECTVWSELMGALTVT